MSPENMGIAEKLIRKYQITEKVINDMTSLNPEFDRVFKVFVDFQEKERSESPICYGFEIPAKEVKKAVQLEIKRLKKELLELKQQIDAL